MDNDKRFANWIRVQAYKHDGLLHRQWSPAFIVCDNEDYWALASRSSAVVESDGRRWMTKEHAIFILYKKKWLNVICMLKDGGGICYYVNVASPAIYDKGYLKYIDYDLDVKLYPDMSIKTLDEQEFERHILTYGYPPELTAAIEKSMADIMAMIKARGFPFVDADIKALYQKFLEENIPLN